MSHSSVSRRGFLATTGAGLIASAFPGWARGAAEPAGRTRTVRFAYLTDTHVYEQRNAPAGFTATLRHVQNRDDKPAFILTGGDHVMESYGANAESAQRQWDIFHRVYEQECSLPLYGTIGNHDTWGWNRQKSGTTGEEPHWGKDRAVYDLKLPNRYYAFNEGGWRFIVLDGTQEDTPTSYYAGLDPEQFDWLSNELKKTPKDTPVIVSTHEPILSAAAFFGSNSQKEGHWNFPRQRMILDAREIKDLFLGHPNVKLCLSGHLHLCDRVEYLGVTYICAGAVSGGWWNGNHQECEEGYGLIDLYDDGTFDYRYVPSGWTPKNEPVTG